MAGFMRLCDVVHRIRNQWNSRNSRCSSQCTQHERANERTYVRTNANFTRLSGIFSLLFQPEKDNRFPYRCSFQGSLNRKKADKQWHKVRVYLRPVCKAAKPRAPYIVHEKWVDPANVTERFSPLTFAAKQRTVSLNSNGVSNGTLFHLGQ